MTKESQDIGLWLRKVQEAASQQEVLSLVDKFRLLDWLDDQRAAMSRKYIAALEKFKQNKQVNPQGAKKAQDSDAPVWYESM